MRSKDLNNIPMPDPIWTYFNEYVDLHKIKVLVENLLTEMEKHEEENIEVDKKIVKVFDEIREIARRN